MIITHPGTPGNSCGHVALASDSMIVQTISGMSDGVWKSANNFRCHRTCQAGDIPDDIGVGSAEDQVRETIKDHPSRSEETLSGICPNWQVLQPVRNHQQLYDDSGYPDWLKGNEIPRVAGIIAVADPFVAMSSDRSYTPRGDGTEVVSEPKKVNVKRFDQAVVEVVVSLLEGEGIASMVKLIYG